MKVRACLGVAVAIGIFAVPASTASATKVQRAGHFTYKTRIVKMPGDGGNSTTATYTVSCGAKHVLSGGMASNAATMLSSYPVDLGDADFVPDDGWRVDVQSPGAKLRVFAICVRRLPQYEYATTALPFEGGFRKATATCSSGRLAAGGYFLEDDVGETEIDAAIPKSGSWTVYAINYTQDLNATHYLTAFAICTPRYKISLRKRLGTVPVRCPGKNRHAIGGGGDPARFFSDTGEEEYTGEVLSMAPRDGKDPDRIPDDLWETDMFSGASASAWAICGT